MISEFEIWADWVVIEVLKLYTILLKYPIFEGSFFFKGKINTELNCSVWAKKLTKHKSKKTTTFFSRIFFFGSK